MRRSFHFRKSFVEVDRDETGNDALSKASVKMSNSEQYNAILTRAEVSAEARVSVFLQDTSFFTSDSVETQLLVPATIS